MRIALFTLCSVFMLAASAAAAPAVMTPGRWEITIKTEAPVETPASTAEICITKEEAEHPEPAKGKPADDCRPSAIVLNGNVLTYTVACGRRNVTSHAKFTYAADHYEGELLIKSGDKEVRQTVTAKRLGNCDDK